MLATTIQAITSFALTQLLSKAAQRLIADLRIQVQQHIGRLSVSFYDANRTGVLVSRIMTDVEGVRNLIGTGLVDFVGGLLTAVLAFCHPHAHQRPHDAACFAFVLAFVLILRKAFGNSPIFRERGKINAEVTGRLTESLGGVRVVKGYHAEAREASVFAGGVQRLLGQRRALAHRHSLHDALLHRYPGRRRRTGDVHGRSAGSAHTTHRRRLLHLHHVSGLHDCAHVPDRDVGTQLTEAIAGLDRTSEILAENEEDPEPAAPSPGTHQGRGTLRRGTFAYEAGQARAPRHLLPRQPGTVTALVGPSGSGKSTIIRLICAFHTPPRARSWSMASISPRFASTATAPSSGWCCRRSFLFDGTIRENVPSPARRDRGAVLDACRIARVDEFAERFPEGYDTIVGERGVKLSGGQRQRISIARAILADPRILILDEATSSLDSETEAMIQNGLSYLMQGRTTFVIAHRLSTIRRADQILVVEGPDRGARHPREPLRPGRPLSRLYARQQVELNRFSPPVKAKNCLKS